MGAFDIFPGETTPNDCEPAEQGRPEPAIGPGQIWLLECAAGKLSAFHGTVLRRANVVLYEPALGAALAEALPIGVYAEKLTASAAAGPAIAPRARQFAADGWSVLLLVERRTAPELGADALLSLAYAPPGAPRGLHQPAPGQLFTANGLAG